MADLRHLFPRDSAATEQYTYGPKLPVVEFKLPSRSRADHGKRLIRQIQSAEREIKDQAEQVPKEARPRGFPLDFCSDPGFKLKLESLDFRPSGIELLNSRVDKDNVMHATVFVPEGKVGIFVRKFESYIDENKGPTNKRTGERKPQNKDLVESISDVLLAVLEQSFWTDAGEFPSRRDEPRWWEVWLREATNPHDVGDRFRAGAEAAGIEVGPREIRFPERRVLLARATVEQWTAFENLFDILAELRLAKTLAGEFLALPPRDQAEFIEEAISRIEAPPENAPAVCHLDTGINRGHPLLELAIPDEHVLTVDPSWSPTDADGHGTEMAGLALYGCLKEILDSTDPIVLRHRLESVKIYRDSSHNEPDLYGHITSQAISRAEIAARPRERRAFCLTVTADGRDEGFPSSWSGAVDQICAGVNEEGVPEAAKRLLFVSAGNTPRDGRHDYPDHNHLHGTHDPAQSWNAVTVGAYTEKAVIREDGYDGWQPIAEPGGLSPASSTSLIWQDRSWPLKPDIVMEGGNNAIDPATGRADDVDDLSLLTTRVSHGGALLAPTGDTSAAAALAARDAAIIWAHYPDLWPETVRGLLVHSARWTDKMLTDFPTHRQNRLRCYGYGVPNLQRALWSLSNVATLVVEETLQPFDKEDRSPVKTKEMHLHRLPSPTQVLEGLGEMEIRMRVTLSYFVEPSPGERGWKDKFRYQSHGLRFDVRRPGETDDDFHKRISKAAREEDEEVPRGGDDRNWEIGRNLRSKGSVHSDTWTGGTAVELARCGFLAVYPVGGWWKERPHLGCWNRQARYALIVTIETSREDVDLYTPIATQIELPVAVEIES